LENILSQEEIDALVKGISSGDVQTQTDTPDQDSEAAPFDLTERSVLPSPNIPTMEVLVDRFSKKVKGTFTSALHRIVEVSPVSSEVKKLGDFLKVLPVPTSIHLFRVEPLSGTALLVFESNLVFGLVEFLMGGGGASPAKIEGREFTNIETRMLGKIVQGALEDLQEAWQVIEPVKITLERSEINPQFAVMMPLSDPLLCIHLDLEIEMTTGTFLLCLPYTMIEPYRERGMGRQNSKSKTERMNMERMIAHLRKTNVEVTVDLGYCSMTVNQILDLRAGSFIALDQSMGESMPVKIEGVPKLQSLAGQMNGKHAVKISGITDHSTTP
jgi:flagellar motor switch protein FliM